MTGTLYNGMASSIYYLLWRALPEFRAAWGWGDVQRFINQYGLFEKITRTYRDQHSTSASGYENFTERKSERPGIHPAMIALLLPSTVFFGIRDLDMILPPYAEHTLFVPRPAEFRRSKRYLDAVKSDAVEPHDGRRLHADGAVQLGQAGRVGRGERGRRGGRPQPAARLPALASMWPKEEALLRLIAREKRAGRKVLCFVGQINRRDPTGRLCGLLERYGMKGAVMRADEKAARRVHPPRAWRAAPMWSSPPPSWSRRASISLRLPTLVWYTAEYNIYLVQQANRRSWRIGQTEHVHVYYLAYDRTPQAWAMHRIAKKLAAAQTLQGDVRQGLAALLGRGGLRQPAAGGDDRTTSTTRARCPWTTCRPWSRSRPRACPEPAGMDVQVKVQTSGHARVRVTVQVEDLRQFQQLSLFG